MKTFYKICFIIAGISLGIGGLLAIIGITSGANIMSLANTRFIQNRKFGIINWNDETSDFNESLINREVSSNIESLELDIDYGEVYIKEGDEFNIKVSNYYKRNININEKNGLLSISSDNDHFRTFGVNLFGVNNWQGHKIIITLPRDFIGRNIDLTLGAGKMEAEKLVAKEISLDVGAGTADVRELIAYEEADLTVGAGAITINKIDGNNVDIDCGVGEIQINDGKIFGKNQIDCGVGSIELRLDGDINDYNYYIDSGIGNVKINDDKYSFTSSSKKINDNATSEFTIDCGVGNIDIRIR